MRVTKKLLPAVAMLASWLPAPSFAVTCEDALSIVGKATDMRPGDTLDDSVLRYVARGWAMHYGVVHKCPQFEFEFGSDDPHAEDQVDNYFMGAIRSLNHRQ